MHTPTLLGVIIRGQVENGEDIRKNKQGNKFREMAVPEIPILYIIETLLSSTREIYYATERIIAGNDGTLKCNELPRLFSSV